MTQNYWPYPATPYDDLFRRYGAQYGIDPHMLRGIAHTESRFNPRAVSPAGAKGLMQFMDPTAADYGFTPEDMFDPEKSVHASAQHLARLRRSYPDWDDEKMLQAYNWGEGNILKGGPLPAETSAYAPQVLGQVASQTPFLSAVRGDILAGKASQEPFLKKVRALSVAPSTTSPSTQKLGDYTQYPKGSKEYFEAGRAMGMQPAVRPTHYNEGSPLPGSTQPFGTGYEIGKVYPMEYKARLIEVVDNDTLLVEDMGSKNRHYVRFPDVQGAESNTPLGAEQKQFMQSMLRPGSDLTINSPGAGAREQGAYGRDLGRVFYHDRQGNTIDLSQPYNVQKDKVADEGQGDPGFLTGLSKSLMLELPEIATFPQEIRSWIDGDYDPNDNPFYAWAEGKEKSWRDTMERYMAYGYDVDGPSVNIPMLGEMRMGEGVRFLTGGAAYTFGLLGVAGKALKGLSASAKAAKAMSASEILKNVDEVAKRSEYAKGLRADLLKRIKAGDDINEELIKNLDDTIAINKEMDQWGQELIEGNASMSGMDRLRTFKDLFISHWSNKYHPLTAVAKKAGGKHGKDAMSNWIHQLNASADVSASPIEHAVRAWFKQDGKYLSKEVYKSLTDIWQMVDNQTMHEAGFYMAWERLVKDLAPEWEKALKEAGGNKGKAIAKAHREGRRLVEVTDKQIARATEDMAWFEARRAKYGDMEEMTKRMADTREWSVKAFLDPLLEVNAISKKSYDNILKSNGHYAPFMRLTDDAMEDVLGADAVRDILLLEDEIANSGKRMGSLIKGGGANATTKTPIGRLTKGLDPDDPSTYIVDPFQAFYTRGMAIQKYANQQRVRNMLGESLDEIMSDTSGYGRWLGKSVQVTSDPNKIKNIMRSGMENSFVRLHADEVTGQIRKTGYISTDPALAQSIKAMSPAHMSMFKQMMQNPLFKKLALPTSVFRSGTVLGLHFMIRNPVRDQFMAAALTKYGYTPVVDWWRGLMGVLSKHPVYRAMHGAGATQSNFTAATLDAAKSGIDDISTGRKLSERIWDILKTEGGAAEKMTAFRNMGGVSGLKEASKNSVKHFMRRGDPAGARITRPARDSFHMLRRVSEIFEEATRTGIAMKAVKRAEKGKKYTFTRSLDDAIGGMSGWGRMIYDAEHRAGAAKRYKASRFVGAKQQKAALAAKKAGKAELDQDMVDEIRNITLDFQRRGHTGEILNAYYPFLNAELQDYARFTKAMAEAPLSTMMRGFAFVSLPAIANWYMNFDNPLYHQQSDIEKELFLHPFGYDPKYKKFGRIPRPVGSVSGFFSLMPHKILDYLARNDPAAIKALEETMWPGKSMRDARNQFQESMYEATEPMPGWLTGAVGMGALGNFPLAGFPEPTGERMEVGGDPLIKDQPALEYAQENLMDYLATNTAARYLMPEDGTLGSIMNTAAPQFAAPFQHLLSNRDPYFRSPIEPPGMANKNLLAADRFTEHTSPIEHFISKMIPWETSPIQAGHMIRRTTGSLGSALLAGSDALGRATGVFDERPGVPKDATDIHGPGAFFGKEPFGSNSSPVRELYQLWDKNEQVWNSLKHNFDLDTKSGAARGSEIMQAYPDWAAAEILKVAVEDMSALHKERREVKSDMNIPDEQRAAILFEIDQYMTQQAYLALEAYNSIIRNPGLAESIINELNE